MLTLFNVPVKKMFVFVTILLIGCKDTDKNSSLIFEELNESLERSNKLIATSSNVILEFLKSRVDDPESKEKTIVWLSLADSIHYRAKYLLQFIDSLKSNLKQNKIEIGPLTSKDLYKKLIAFKEFVFQQNLYLKTSYHRDIETLGKETKSDADFYKINFLNNDVAIIYTMLSKIENNIVVVTNNVMSFCNGQVSGRTRRNHEMFQPMATINSTKFGKGEELTITTGIGEFILKDNLSFNINGENIEPDENGIGRYKTKIKNVPGKYKVHVKIKYTERDGRDVIFEKDIDYAVTE